MEMLQIAALAIFIVVLVFGAVGDVRSRRIPNWLCLVLAAIAFGLAILPGDLSGMGSNVLHAVIALLVGMALFAAGLIGGGDAKFYAAAALAFPLGLAFNFLGWTSLVGLGLLVLMTVFRKQLPRKKDGKSPFTVPYGVAIAGGAIITVWPYLEELALAA